MIAQSLCSYWTHCSKPQDNKRREETVEMQIGKKEAKVEDDWHLKHTKDTFTKSQRWWTPSRQKWDTRSTHTEQQLSYIPIINSLKRNQEKILFVIGSTMRDDNKALWIYPIKDLKTSIKKSLRYQRKKLNNVVEDGKTSHAHG